MLELNTVYNADCLTLMHQIPDKSVDLILCDLPYQITNCKWDILIPFKDLWSQYNRIIKDNCAIVLTASQPFTAALIMSNPKMFKYEWIWEKEQGSNFLSAKNQPLKNHENIIVFGKGKVKYNPQMTPGKPYTSGQGFVGEVYGKTPRAKVVITNNGVRYPKTIQRFNRESGLHPTQKPVALFEYLIQTYSSEGDVVIDNCAGSCTTAIAAINTNRNYIMIEKDPIYYQTGLDRINNHLNQCQMK